MARGTITTLLAVAFAVLVAAPAEATLVYVKDAGGLHPRVFVARDDGTQPHKLGAGHTPKVSPDGRWVAWIRPGSPDQVMMRLADRTRKARVVGRSAFVGEFHFSPDRRSTRKDFVAASGRTRTSVFSTARFRRMGRSLNSRAIQVSPPFGVS